MRAIVEADNGVVVAMPGANAGPMEQMVRRTTPQHMSSVLLLIGLLTSGVAPAALAQGSAPSRFGITDNSFLVEEAFNQEPGIFQNIFVLTRTRDGVYDGSVTQEWPVVSMRHQFSFTMPFSAVSGQGAVGDLMLNYRFQVSTGDGRAPAFSPRVSLIVPTSAPRRPMGGDGIGWQVNLPFSRAVGPLFFHGNAGTTLLQGEQPDGALGDWSHTPFVAGSAIVALTPMLNVVLETMAEWERIDGGRERSVTVSPGLRTGWNLGDRQVVVGVAVPVTRGAHRDHAVLGYFSYELPFRHQ